MKKAVAYLVPYMEKEREEREAELKAQGLEITEEVRKLLVSDSLHVFRISCNPSCVQN